MRRMKSMAVIFSLLVVIVSPLISQSYSISESDHQNSSVTDLETTSPESQKKNPDDSSKIFPFPPSLRVNVDFWKNIYTKFNTNEIIIHDSKYLNIIYKVLKISDSYGQKKTYYSRSTRRKIKREKRKYKKLLRSIHYTKKSGKSLTTEEKRIASLFDSVVGKNKFLIASRSIRSQLGQKDRFIEGIKSSGRYLDKMKTIFRQEGIPEELTVIPHIESSFNYKAYSSAGAVGVWQFMRSTARLFMKVNYVIDERRDPIASTKAAARLLKRNYKSLSSWPLAITAYNHGLGGMKRAQKRFGNNMERIINKYNSRSFGFASRNFYCEFLAALEITRNSTKYFGKIELYPPIEYDILPIKKFIYVDNLSSYLKLNKNTIREMNLSLRRPVFESRKLIPKGYLLKVPKSKGKTLKKLYAAIPIKEQKNSQKPSEWYRVRRGDTLYQVARRFRTSVTSLMNINNVDSVHRIYAGQVLRLPIDKKISATPTQVTKKTVKSYKKKSKAKPTIKNVWIAKEKQGFSKKLYGVLTPSPAIAENREYGLIRVESEETLGHYSEWSGVRASTLRKLNGIRRRRHSIVIGQKLKIPFDRVSMTKFEEKRAEYHMSLQEDFFSNYKVIETLTYQMELGDTVWYLSQENDIPIWLLKRYNPGSNFRKLRAGDKLSLPVISAIN